MNYPSKTDQQLTTMGEEALQLAEEALCCYPLGWLLLGKVLQQWEASHFDRKSSKFPIGNSL